MEQKLVRVPFDLEMAKKITNEEIEGKIVTADGRAARIADFNLKEKGYPLLVISDDSDGGELYYSCSLDGKVDHQNDSLSDLMLEIPEYLTFKDGDILSNGIGFVFILNGNGKHKTSLYACTDKTGDVKFGGAACSDDIDRYTFATEAEEQKLLDALKASKEPKAKEYLKRFFGIEEKPKCGFKPKDWVLTREDSDDKWCLNIFSHIAWDDTEECYHYYCVGGWNYECIPYNEQTAHLLGTTEDYKGD